MPNENRTRFIEIMILAENRSKSFHVFFPHKISLKPKEREPNLFIPIFFILYSNVIPFQSKIIYAFLYFNATLILYQNLVISYITRFTKI